MKLPAVPRILNSRISLSRPVILLQIPIAFILALGFSARLPNLMSRPILVVLFAAAFILGMYTIFALGNWIIEKQILSEQYRPLVVFGAWWLTGFQCLGISELVHHFTTGTLVPLKIRILFVPLMWIASLLSTANVFQSRQEYVSELRTLHATNESLIHIEERSHFALQKERLDLIDTVRKRIVPELESISAEIRAIEIQSKEEYFVRILEQIDEYSFTTIRRLILELNEVDEFDTSLKQDCLITPVPKLSFRNLPLDPMRSLQITVGVGAVLLLPAVGIPIVLLWLLQVIAIFAPIFALHAIRIRITSFSKVPEVTWVLLACAIAVVLRVFVIDSYSQVQIATVKNYLPLVSGLFLTIAIILGSLDKYFVSEYSLASEKQATANFQLEQKLTKLNSSRQITRKELSRLLHGPIQGRLAAIRLTLNMIAEHPSVVSAGSTQLDIEELAKMVERVNDEITSFSEPHNQLTELNVSDALDELALNWQGLIFVNFVVSPEALSELSKDQHLSRKVVAACSEAITNASRHGNAKAINIELSVTKETNTLLLTAIDNGYGIPVTVSPGIGLSDIEVDGGQWSFDSCETGTRFRVEFLLSPTSLHVG